MDRVLDGLPEGCAWGLWDRDGKKDIYGTLNLLTPRVVQGAFKEARDGINISLNWPMGSIKTPGFGRKALTHKIITFRGTANGFHGYDDQIEFNTQISSQWDGLCHYLHQGTNLAYNGIKTSVDQLSQGSDKEKKFPTLNHLHDRGGIVARGVFIDYKAYADAFGIKMDMFNNDQIMIEDIEKIAKYQGVEFKYGDILIIRSGFTEALGAMADEEQVRVLASYRTCGVEGTKKAAKWIWNKHFSAVAGDMMGFEHSPCIIDGKDGKGGEDLDIIIVGAGPVGLTLANHLGLSGVRVLVIEKLDQLIDYPRAIGIDDESLRLLQALQLVDHVIPHTTPNHSMRFLTARGVCFADFQPTTLDFGWPRRNAFIQPEIDKILLKGLERFTTVQVLFSQTLLSVEQDEKGVTVTTDKKTFRARYLIGADGGSSFVRKQLKIPFEGTTAPNKWIVVDIRNDPLGIPNLYVCCDPMRPYVSAALPHGIRRFEFMVMDDETEEQLREPKVMRELFAKVVPDPDNMEIIQSRVYSHNARLAAQFRSGRVLLAGDAAHIMPVWQGQGYNSGLRDSLNLAWKLARVIKGTLDPQILDTFESERRPHAKAMLDLSVLTGHIFAPPYRWLGWLRDTIIWLLGSLPSVKRYFLEMRFKPMPRYGKGAAMIPEQDTTAPVGIMFIQPFVFKDGGHEEIRLDDIIGSDKFALISWGTDPLWGLNPSQIAAWRQLGTTFIHVVPACQLKAPQDPVEAKQGVIRIGDSREGALKKWFGNFPRSIAVIRPDRFVGALAIPQTIGDVSDRFFGVIGLISDEH
ncbi:3-(3-hydroxy-phenyl)propionate hydroxylase [Fusarium mundagurra]|uniref:3-(3-hydroxy-phenyl)propionate hydroxylase n=1 Tax=Fusarium mundagurra TaxID=1567541 RepID=A0A8H5YF11_9HYPO|nr:3-(3-hydroxy-phenyl)propionate hydroxylase [Fusarium mundagurra]